MGELGRAYLYLRQPVVATKVQDFLLKFLMSYQIILDQILLVLCVVQGKVLFQLVCHLKAHITIYYNHLKYNILPLTNCMTKQ